MLVFADREPVSLDDLPPLPFATDGFYATRLDWPRLFDTVTTIENSLTKKLAPETRISDAQRQQIRDQIGLDLKRYQSRPSDGSLSDSFRERFGVDLQADLLEPLGDILTLYGDTRQGMFGMGTGLVIKVDDPQKLRTSLDKIFRVIGEAAGEDLQIKHAQRLDRDLTYLEFPKLPFVSPTLAVDKQWLVIGLYPQTVQSFLLRLDGKLSKWEPAESTSKALEELPRKFISVAVSDPREGIRSLIGIAPALLSLFSAHRFHTDGTQTIEIPFADVGAGLPPAEAVTRPLFVNLSICTADDAEIRWTSRTSLPAVPLLGVAGLTTGAATEPILAAVLMPSVWQAHTKLTSDMTARKCYEDYVALEKEIRQAHENPPADWDKKSQQIRQRLKALNKNFNTAKIGSAGKHLRRAGTFLIEMADFATTPLVNPDEDAYANALRSYTGYMKQARKKLGMGDAKK